MSNELFEIGRRFGNNNQMQKEALAPIVASPLLKLLGGAITKYGPGIMGGALKGLGVGAGAGAGLGGLETITDKNMAWSDLPSNVANRAMQVAPLGAGIGGIGGGLGALKGGLGMGLAAKSGPAAGAAAAAKPGVVNRILSAIGLGSLGGGAPGAANVTGAASAPASSATLAKNLKNNFGRDRVTEAIVRSNQAANMRSGGWYNPSVIKQIQGRSPLRIAGPTS